MRGFKSINMSEDTAKIKDEKRKAYTVMAEGKTRDQKDVEYNKRSKEWFNRPAYNMKGVKNGRSESNT